MTIWINEYIKFNKGIRYSRKHLKCSIYSMKVFNDDSQPNLPIEKDYSTKKQPSSAVTF